MKMFTILLAMICSSFLCFAQKENEKLIELGKAYKDFMFRNDPGKQDLKELRSNVPADLKMATDFIIEAISKENKLLSSKFLSRPADETLKQVFIIWAININLREEEQVDNDLLIDSLLAKPLSVYQLLDNYYGMLFTSVGNKNQPFDLSKTDIRIKDYNLKNDTERGILFLTAMKLCGTIIWGYMNVVDPPNTKKALDHIKLFPSFNGRPYFQYTDLFFPDFDLEKTNGKGLQSYKSTYLDKYYETLLSHLICLAKEGGTEKEKNDLILGSILKDRELYKYTRYKETLESIIKVKDR